MKRFLFFLVTTATALGADATRLHRELQKTDRWLQASGPNAVAGWKKFLRWGDLEAELSKPSPDLDTLRLILNRWRKNNVGLEAPEFVCTQRALKSYLRQVELDQVEDRAAACRQWAAEAAASVDDQPGALLKGKAAGWLAYACPEARADAERERAPYAKPNLRIQASAKSLTFGFPGMEIHNRQYQRNFIQGISVSGPTATDGKISARPAPASGRGEIEILMNATINAPSNFGQKGRVGIYSRSSGTAQAVARLAIDENGIHLASAGAHASMHPQVTAIDAPGPLIRLLALWKVNRTRAATAAEASWKAAAKVRNEFVRTIFEKLPDSNQYLTKPKNVLHFQGTYPERFNTFSTAEALGLLVTERNSFQLAANSEPPVLSGKYDLKVDLHESFVGNFMAPFMGGKQEWDDNLFNVHKLLTTEEPAELRVHDNTFRWYFWVDQYRPFTTDFQDGKMRLRFYGARIGRVHRGEEEKTDRPFVITVVYEPVLGKRLGFLRRLGDVTVEYTDDEKSTEASDKLSTMLLKKMDAFFPENFELGGLTIPKGSGWEKLRKFKLKQFRIHEGWLTLGLLLED